MYLAELMKKKKKTGGQNVAFTSSGAKKLKRGSLYLYVGNGARAEVEAIGSFDLVFPNGLIIVLDNCHYAPSITRGKAVKIACKHKVVEQIELAASKKQRPFSVDEEEELLESDDRQKRTDTFFQKSRNAISFNYVKNPEFKKMIQMVGDFGSGLDPSSYHEMRVTYLKKEVDYTKALLEDYKKEWKKTGCTLMSDGWSDRKNRSICNFLVNSPKGEEHIVQVVTDNAANHKAVGEMLMDKRKKTFWTPCVAHCIDLMLEDFEKKVEEHKVTISNGRKITSFIYNRTQLICLLMEFTNGNELLRPGATRFATSYLTLGRLHEQKDSTPATGFIYHAMKKAKEEIKSNYKSVQSRYEPIINIIDARWDNQLNMPLHVAGYFLNLRMQYSLDFKGDIPSLKLNLYMCIEKMRGSGELVDEIDCQLDMFKNKKGHLFNLKLKRFAMRALSLTCSSSGCERNGSAFEMKMNDLVYVMYNLKLTGREQKKIKEMAAAIEQLEALDFEDVESDDEKGASCFITFTDDYSRYGYVYLLKHKHEVFETFKVFKSKVENQLENTIKAIRSDRGGEYISQEFKDYLKACGIVQQLTPPYIPQHNGVSERHNCTLLNMVRSMMSLATLPLSFWDYALEFAARILNMVPTKKVDKTPSKLWHGKVYNLSYLKVWGCEAHVKRHTPDKLQQRSVKCIFIGYPKETMGYYFYYPPENKIVVERYEDFLEKDFILQKESGRIVELEDEDILPSENTSEHPIEEESLAPIFSQEEDVIPIRRFVRTDKAPDRLCLNVEIDPYRLCFNVEVEEHSLGDLNEPANYKVALPDPEFEKWLVAMNAKMQSMYINKVWRLVVLPPNAKVVKKMKRMQNVPYALAVRSIMYAVSDPEAELRVNCYCDAGFETDRDDTKSQTGYVFILNGGAMVWKSSKQSTTAQHATEAEYIAAFEAAKEDVWIRKFIDELGVVPSNDYPIKMNCDNSAAIIMAKESGIQKGARHFKRKYYYVRECIKTGKIDIVKVHTDGNLADPFTKALSGPKLTRHARSMSLRPGSSFM
nr:zinc finger, CCHC-type [Tanacetum cinerariifolium]